MSSTHFRRLVVAALDALAAAGELPAGLDPDARRGRAAARPRARRPRDQRRDGAGEGRRSMKPRGARRDARAALARRARAPTSRAARRSPGRASSISRSPTAFWHARLARHPARRHRLRRLRRSGGRQGQCRVSSRPTRPGRCMSATAAARWSATRWPRCSPRPASRSPASTTSTTPARRSTCSARSLYLRYREALGEDDRRDPRGALSRRLSDRRRRGARRARRRALARHARSRMAAPSARLRDRADDGADPRRSRRARRQHRRLHLRARDSSTRARSSGARRRSSSRA